jgi:hypothetical protein
MLTSNVKAVDTVGFSTAFPAREGCGAVKLFNAVVGVFNEGAPSSRLAIEASYAPATIPTQDSDPHPVQTVESQHGDSGTGWKRDFCRNLKRRRKNGRNIEEPCFEWRTD